LDAEIINKLEEILRNRPPVAITKEGAYIQAAVMMILTYGIDGVSLLFIKRPENDKDPFSGHMAFPGGKRKQSDESRLETAMRETYEEIGVDLNGIARVLGTLDDINPNNPRANHYIVTPYLCYLHEEVEFKPDAHEVEEVLWVPIEHLRDDNNRMVRPRERDGKQIEDYVYNYGQYIIWGMTGRIVNQFLSFTEDVL